MSAKWLVTIEGKFGTYEFKKSPNPEYGTVNIYLEGEEIDVFTIYGIKDIEDFERECADWLEESTEYA